MNLWIAIIALAEFVRNCTGGTVVYGRRCGQETAVRFRLGLFGRPGMGNSIGPTIGKHRHQGRCGEEIDADLDVRLGITG